MAAGVQESPWVVVTGEEKRSGLELVRIYIADLAGLDEGRGSIKRRKG